MKKRKTLLIAGLGMVLTILISLGGCESTSIFGEDQYVEKVDRTLDAAGVSVIDAQTENGAITLVGSTRALVIVQAFKEVRASNLRNAEEFAEEIQVFVVREGNQIRIYKTHPKPPRGMNVNVRYDIQSPSNLDLNIQTTNGKITISDVDSTVYAVTSNGKIELHRASGHANLHTSNGAIAASLGTLREEGVFSTSNGSIDVKIRNGVASVVATTSNGSIDLTLPDNFSGQLDAKTTNGHVSSEVPVLVHVTRGQNLKSNHLVGQIGEGGDPTVTLRSSNGNIHLDMW
jgi:hypothetical protein